MYRRRKTDPWGRRILRLPVIQLVPHQIKTQSEFMRDLNPGSVDVTGVTLVVVLGWRPIEGVPQSGIVGNIKCGKTAWFHPCRWFLGMPSTSKTDILAIIRTIS